jgi:hypothetical protein
MGLSGRHLGRMERPFGFLPPPWHRPLRRRVPGTAEAFLALAILLMAAGCSAVDREAAAFPEMPHNPVYYRLDGRPVGSEEGMAALQAAASACRDQATGGGGSRSLGSPAFDACMRAQGYGRTR